MSNKIFQYTFLIFMLAIATLILIAPEIRMLSEYMVHIMFLFFIAGLFFLIINQKKLLLTSFAIAGLLCVILKNASNDDLITPSRNNLPQLKILHFNLANIDNPFELNTSIAKQDPDIISFQELTPDWSVILNQMLKRTYPYIAEIVRIDIYGKAVYSRLPYLKIDTLNNKHTQDLKILCSDGPFEYTLYSTYITPPLDAKSKLDAERQLLTISKDVDVQPKPVIVFGEFNTVYWSEVIRNFRTNAHLNNSRKDVVPASFKLPYEHIFFSSLLQCVGEENVLNDDNVKIGYQGAYQINDSSVEIVGKS